MKTNTPDACPVCGPEVSTWQKRLNSEDVTYACEAKLTWADPRSVSSARYHEDKELRIESSLYLVEPCIKGWVRVAKANLADSEKR